MAKVTNDELDRFRELVLAGKTKFDIKNELDIKREPRFAELELQLIKTDNKIYNIPSGPIGDSIDNIVSIGKKKNLVIPSKILSQYPTFKEDHKFTVTARGKKIILTLVEEKPS